MISALIGWGVSERLAKFLAYVALPALVIGAFALAIKWHGDARFREGKAVERAAWEAAEAALHRRALNAGTQADAAAHERETAHAIEVERQRERINADLAAGQSPFDSMFGRDVGGVRGE